tara:strand:- start:656 stop:805 length:150 start_codon:yes stop_codon:yes gene_type:complete
MTQGDKVNSTNIRGVEIYAGDLGSSDSPEDTATKIANRFKAEYKIPTDP